MNPEGKQFTSMAAGPASPPPGYAQAAAPAGLFIVLGVLFFWSTLYLDRHAGGFEAKVYHPYHSLKELDALAPKDTNAVFLAKGKTLYNNYCSVCHQATGLGSAGIAPPLAGSEWPLAPGPNRVVRIILSGLSGPVQVKGQEYNLVMVPFRDMLKDEEVAAIATYIRGNKEWGHKASTVAPAQVKPIRDQTAGRGAWTAPELLAIPDSDAPAAK